ncbi:SPV140 tyrosine protein kinase-like protein [Swinepox virus]|uniref:SPV140 tyrosine protein kinase-like protein n=2 Tax=Swinepox virus TaxID=10276 RepID=Q8V3F6_SWPV1|nr:hypothetical protein SWPVgp140 [Swinepox virus]AAL69879.1 SPV140 tyrosine protein kinase-like protein [Swinepox virus]QQG31632.1 tyrosine protein kinase-like protein [Swinepox virus]UED36597.1 hypothetical protein SPVwb_139 [Swinepox virus]UED36746.1 hypothetical protein SPVdp_141 [Swinepox virus]UUA44330.1 SPV140 [Swinepox virus]
MMVDKSFWNLVSHKICSRLFLDRKYVNNAICIESTSINNDNMIIIKENEQLSIYRGEFNNKDVLIKTFKKFHIGHKVLIDITENEIKNMKKIDSNNILRIYAFYVEMVDDLPRLSLILEYCKRGYLKNVLMNEKQLLFKTRLDMAIDCCNGLYNLYKYTNKPYGYISSNVFLVEENYKVKIIAHGLEKVMSSPSFKDINTSVYLSPKLINNIFSKHNLEDDVYSLGILLWEIFTGDVPYKNLSIKELFKNININELRLEISGHTFIKNIVNHCLVHDEVKRPNLKDILYNLSMYKIYFM